MALDASTLRGMIISILKDDRGFSITTADINGHNFSGLDIAVLSENDGVDVFQLVVIPHVGKSIAT